MFLLQLVHERYTIINLVALKFEKVKSSSKLF